MKKISPTRIISTRSVELAPETPFEPLPWWVGKRYECANCHTVVELEASDQIQTRWSRFTGAGVVVFDCPSCSHSVSRKEDDTAK